MRAVNRTVYASRADVALFNARWPCSELKVWRSYRFDFDGNRNLVDSNVPPSHDGSAALALSQDCERFLFDATLPDWL